MKKMVKKVLPGFIGLAAMLYACGAEEVPPGSNGPGGNNPGGNGNGNLKIWNIPQDEVYDGGPGKDGIPALENPLFIEASEAAYLADNDLVMGYKNGNEVRAYPHPILDWHEIINDKVNDHAFAVTYCPLTGTGIGWERVINGWETTFGVSGLLYNSNLIPYDRRSDSHWSQMKLECVNGFLRDSVARTFHLVETTWGTWKAMYPETKVVSTQTGYSRNYNRYPYGDYKTNHNSYLFPYTPIDERLPGKERVHGIIVGRSAKAFRFGSFPDGGGLIQEVYNNAPIVVLTNHDRSYIVSFKRTLEDGTVLNFRKPDEQIRRAHPSVILEDSEGNLWDIFGEAIAGSRTGQRLKPTTSFMGYWFAWGAFYPGIDLQ
jgi:hypothetical protein